MKSQSQLERKVGGVWGERRENSSSSAMMCKMNREGVGEKFKILCSVLRLLTPREFSQRLQQKSKLLFKSLWLLAVFLLNVVSC